MRLTPQLYAAPLVQSCASVGILLQWMQLEPHAWYSTVLRISWIYVIWGCPATVWHDSHRGPNDLGTRMRASEPIQHFSRDHAEVRTEQIERILLGFTDLACASANAERRGIPGTAEAVNAAVAAVPTLTLCSMVVSQAKAELDEKAATMATIRQLGANTARMLSLVRFASHCLREMDAAYKRGEISTENGIRSGSLYIASSALCSSVSRLAPPLLLPSLTLTSQQMAETIAEWKSHCDAQATSGRREIIAEMHQAGPAHSSAGSTSTLAAHAPGLAPSGYHLYTSAPHGQPHAAHYHASQQQQLDDQAFVQSMAEDPGQWNFLLANWLEVGEASHAQAAPFDWAGVFGLPNMR